MATQHPDNAKAPYWEQDGDTFVSAKEEPAECVDAFQNLNVEEFMWDWEGKFAEEAVIDRLFHKYFDYFKENQLGLKKRLTFRIPNIWQEKGYSLIRALMVILTSEDFARDLKFHSPPLFEVILPMTENAKQLIFIQKSFQELAKIKSKIFNQSEKNAQYINIIPLFEDVHTQINAKRILIEYIKLHKRTFGFKPKYLRVFIARSDPAMSSGMVSTVLANKIILSDLCELEKESGIPIYPILGAGSLPFRGGLSPLTMKEFDEEYRGIHTITIQSAFRYDYKLSSVKKAIKYYNQQTIRKPEIISSEERSKLLRIINLFEKEYKANLKKILPDVSFVFNSFPRRRERHLHIGLLSYGRKIHGVNMPRAITFTGSFYSLGIPPEFLDVGAILSLTDKEVALVNKFYKNTKGALSHAGRFLNRNNLRKLGKKSKSWAKIEKDIEQTENFLKIKFKTQSKDDIAHLKLTGMLLKSKKNPKKIKQIINKTGILRKSLG
ncbi:MAG: phosphoenolpyruvate carboxylase [Patescibacteria group bacterium]